MVTIPEANKESEKSVKTQKEKSIKTIQESEEKIETYKSEIKEERHSLDEDQYKVQFKDKNKNDLFNSMNEE